MRLFDDDKIGCFLDHIAHRVEKTKDGDEVKLVDLTLRVQPFSPELATALDPDARALLFRLDDATPKPKIKALTFALKVPPQALRVYHAPDSGDAGALLFTHVKIGNVRARTEKDVTGFALAFTASLEPGDAAELEYICDWLTQERWVTFDPQQQALPFGAAETRA